jgi:penicillin-binding protein 2
VDLPDENTGNVPDAAWRERLNKQETACRKTNDGVPCYAVDIRPYNLGDNVNLAVGQGDFLATPLQMATAYSAIANGGRVVKPHLGSSVEDNQGRLVQRLSHGAARKVSLPTTDLDAIRTGLHEAASTAGGTSASVFTGWPQGQLPIYGKTGTAQTGNLEAAGDQSWYVAYVPRTGANSRPLVVAATIEKGGFGAAAAAPTVCRVLAKWYDRTNVPCTPGTNTDQ